MADRQAAADSVVRLLTLAERRGVISGAEHRYARDVIEALSVRLAQAEQERDGYLARVDEVNVERQRQEVRAIEAEVRLREYEEALTRADNALHEAEARLVLCHASGPEPGNVSRINSALADVREARAALAASGGREAPDTKEPN